MLFIVQFCGKEFSSTATNKKKASQAAALEALKFMASKVTDGPDSEVSIFRSY